MKSFARAGIIFLLSVSFAACSGTASGPTVPSPAVASALTISGFTTLSNKGDTGRLTAMVSFSDGSVQDKSAVAQWSSGDPAVATVSNAGNVTAVDDGHTLVTATFSNVAGTRLIIVDLKQDTP